MTAAPTAVSGAEHAHWREEQCARRGPHCHRKDEDRDQPSKTRAGQSADCEVVEGVRVLLITQAERCKSAE